MPESIAMGGVRPRLSIVAPVYGCRNCLPELYERLTAALQKITPDFEIILVNDASPDEAWETIVEMARQDPKVKGINLSRNFGQHYAITAGLEYSQGDWVVVMDCDLQDKPEEIVKLFTKIQEGYEIVFARRKNRKDRFFKKAFSRIFYKIFDYFTDTHSDSSISNFGIFSSRVVQNYLHFTEKVRTFPLMIKWLGYEIGYVDVEHAERASGKSSYSFLKLLALASNAIISQSNKPLKISIKVGFFMSFVSMLYLVYLIIRKIFLDIPLGWTSIMVSMFFIGGMIFANLGLIGLYIGKIYDEAKNRPLYIVKEVIGSLKDKKNG